MRTGDNNELVVPREGVICEMERGERVARLEAWRKLWEQPESPSHYRDYVHSLLRPNFSHHAGGRENLRILVPLCGKSLDMKWLADQGHTVIGVEAVEMPVKAFFVGQSIDYTVEVRGDRKLYQSEDGRITIHVSDLFTLSREDLGTFDIVWDRASFVALKKEQRKSYVTLLTSLLGAGCRYLLCTVDIKRTSGEPHTGPPHVTQQADLEELFGTAYTVSFADRLDCTTDADPRWGVLWFHEVLFLIKLRTSTGLTSDIAAQQ